MKIHSISRLTLISCATMIALVPVQTNAQNTIAGGSFSGTVPAFSRDGETFTPATQSTQNQNQQQNVVTPIANPASQAPVPAPEVMVDIVQDITQPPVNTQPVGAPQPLTPQQDAQAAQVAEVTKPLPPIPQVQQLRRSEISNSALPFPGITPQTGIIVNKEIIQDIGTETLVTRKIVSIRKDLSGLQSAVGLAKTQLENIRFETEAQAEDYYALVAAIHARLQAGTTPGNPRLINSWNIAQERLDQLALNVSDLNDLGASVAAQANTGNFLLDAIRAAYGLSGALDSDHAQLALLEDESTNTVVNINRLLNEISDDVNRRSTLLTTERRNLQALALGITNGELYGRSLSNRFFDTVPDPSSPAGQARLSDQGKRPLAIIRFNRPDVNYEQPVFAALTQALDRNPGADFEIIAVSPAVGNPAQTALSATDARRKAEGVMRNLSNMGLPVSRLAVSAAQSQEADESEVHIYIR